MTLISLRLVLILLCLDYPEAKGMLIFLGFASSLKQQMTIGSMVVFCSFIEARCLVIVRCSS